MEERLPWDAYFMELAKVAAKRSACLSRKVGCVLVDVQHRIVSTGYCGPPRNYGHCTTCIRKLVDAPGESLYHCPTIHAEMNALLQCKDIDRVHACYTTTSPCFACMKLLYNTNCEKIYFLEPYPGYEKVLGFWAQKENSIMQRLFL